MHRRYEIVLRSAFGGLEVKRIVSANTKRAAARMSRMGLRRDIGIRSENYEVVRVRYIPLTERKD